MTDELEPRYSFGDDHLHVMPSGQNVWHSHGGPAADVPLFAHPIAYTIAHPDGPARGRSCETPRRETFVRRVQRWLGR